MFNILAKRTIGIFLIFALSHCNTSTQNPVETVKQLQNDPFKATIVPSQLFNIDGKKDNVVEGEKGTVLVFPEGCFKNAKGEIVKENIKIELSEALSMEDMLLSNLTTTSDGKPLITDGMIYFNATANGEQLVVNKDNPVHFEIPTLDKKPRMMAYKGTRDEKGNMNWTDPKELDKYLVPVDINLLDFLPEGFQAAVDNEMAHKARKLPADSLYYSLSVSNGSELLNGLVGTNYNEAYYNKNKKVVNGKYPPQSYEIREEADSSIDEKDSAATTNCGIDPAIIKVIKSEKYQNTLIATREFEARLKVIFETCNNSVLEIYIKNLDKNLYEEDSMALKLLSAADTGDEVIGSRAAFRKFYNEKCTKVKNADKYASLLKGYYEKQLTKVKGELKEANDKLVKSLQQKNKEAEKLAVDYEKLLWKREKCRMETYGFNWTETGWINIDNGTIPKTWGMEPLEVVIENGKQFNRIYPYVVYTSIKSLYRCNTTDNEKFYVGNSDEKEMLMPKQQEAVLIAIGYKGDTPYYTIKQFTTGAETNFPISLVQTTLEKFKEATKPYDNYAHENQIKVDLDYMYKFYLEKKRQETLKKDKEFLQQLRNIAFPCCSGRGPRSRLEGFK